MGEINNRSQEERELTQEELTKLQTLRVQIRQIYKKEKIMWSQRARINWVKQILILSSSTKRLAQEI